MQGVECYGLDNYLPRVWELPMFSTCLSSENAKAPPSTWVENYISLLAKRCYAVVHRARQNHKLEEQQKSEQRKQDDEERRHEEVKGVRDDVPNAQVPSRQQMVDDTHELEETEAAKQAEAAGQEKPAVESIPAANASVSIAEQQPEVVDEADVAGDVPSASCDIAASGSTSDSNLAKEEAAPSDSTAVADDTAIPEPSAPCEPNSTLEIAHEDSTTSTVADKKGHEARSSFQTGLAFLQAVKAKLTKTASEVMGRQDTQSEGRDRTPSRQDEPNQAPDNSAREMMIALREVRGMKAEDPYFSKRVRDVWMEQVASLERPVQRPAMASAPVSESKKATGPIDQWVSSASMTTPPPRAARKRRAASISSHGGGADSSTPTSHGTGNETGGVTDLTGSGDDGSASATASTTGSAQEQPTASGQKRKRAPRSWEVIVIDDSDDDENYELAIAKRTTRSRRRQRGESLTDGLH
ncbi:hypothetical protein PINS_up015241 [Pythium insidiosum]|nr:hypothetical protein PINS_up015241 [Pythium insidiosum]